MRKVVMVGFILASSSAVADSLKGDFPVCISKEYLDEAVQASIKKDQRQWNWLFSTSKCINPKPGVPVSVLESSWGKVKVRVYAESGSMILWTVRENIVTTK
jgi:hypothetical protein